MPPALPEVSDFFNIEVGRLKWIRKTKLNLMRGKTIQFDKNLIRTAMYRPYFKQFYYFESGFNEDLYQMPRFFPRPEIDAQNRMICVTDRASEKPFMVLMTNVLVDLHIVGAGANAQCFPFYTYGLDGAERRENISDTALAEFEKLFNVNLTKWQIFHYVYGLLHSPEYREMYKANLKRELPRIPLPKDIEQFRAFVSAGERLAELHVNYESQPEYRLDKIENPDKQLNWRVQKMKLTKDKTAIVYNDFLTLSGIPPEAFEYKLGNRSALEWIIDRYQIHTDKRSGIVNDPNRPDDEEYIVRLIGKVITVSLETIKVVSNLPKI
jgi:predicted helicase